MVRGKERGLQRDNKEEDRRLHLDRSLPLWVLPSQIRQTEDSQADGKLRLGLVDGLCFFWWYLYDIWRPRPGWWKAETWSGWCWGGLYPGGKANIVHQGKDAGREEVATGQDRLQRKYILRKPEKLFTMDRTDGAGVILFVWKTKTFFSWKV